MKHTFKSPVFIINALLIAFLAMLALNANADRLHLPRVVKQALAAVELITGSGNTGRLTAFAGNANQIGDSIMSESGLVVTVGGELSATQVNSPAFQGQGGSLAIQGCPNCPSMQFLSDIIRANGRLEMGSSGSISFPGNGTIVANSNQGGGRIDINAATVALNNASPGGTDFWATRLHGTLGSISGDYAEWFEKEGEARPGDLIGISRLTGKVRKYQQGDHFLGIYSVKPAIVTNAQASDEEMGKTHILVGLLGQLDFDHSQTVIEGRTVKTLDGAYVGILLSNGKVLIGR